MKFSEFFAAVINALGREFFVWTNESEVTSTCLDIIHDGYSLAMTDALDSDGVDVWPSHIGSIANEVKLAES